MNCSNRGGFCAYPIKGSKCIKCGLPKILKTNPDASLDESKFIIFSPKTTHDRSEQGKPTDHSGISDLIFET